MGQRANLLIVSGGSYELYYTHHRANTLHHDLFWGPDYAQGFIRAQRRSEALVWLDEVWAEGGVVLDVDDRVLLWFGGEDVRYDIGLRRVHAGLMRHLWPGWDVRWAAGGVTDIADYVGHPRTMVLSERDTSVDRAVHPVLLEPGDPNLAGTLASFRLPSGELIMAAVAGYCHEILQGGEAILPLPRMAAGWPDSLMTGDPDGAALGGFHLDVPARAIDFWTADPTDSADVHRRVQERWTGWAVNWHRDRFESQAERAGGRLIFRYRDPTVHRATLREWLLRPDDDRMSGAEAIVGLAERLGGKGFTVTGVNPAALYDAQLSVPLEVRTRMFDAAVAATA